LGIVLHLDVIQVQGQCHPCYGKPGCDYGMTQGINVRGRSRAEEYPKGRVLYIRRYLGYEGQGDQRFVNGIGTKRASEATGHKIGAGENGRHGRRGRARPDKNGRRGCAHGNKHGYNENELLHGI
jgi:hypothetical protein